MIYWFELVGTAVFAVSGALAASRKNMDIFGFAVLALMPAVGGGTLRDVLIDRHPIFWIADINYVYVAVGSAVITFFAAHVIRSRLRTLIWMDAIGLAFFAVLGSQIAVNHGMPMPVAAIMGMVTGVIGGMIRDVICNEVPLILSREIYATAAFAAAGVYLGASAAGMEDAWSVPLGILVGFAIRAAGIATGFSLPIYKQRN